VSSGKYTRASSQRSPFAQRKCQTWTAVSSSAGPVSIQDKEAARAGTTPEGTWLSGLPVDAASQAG
jgi:hypothetical protein